MMSMSHIQSPPLPKVQTQKQFMEALYDRIRPPRTLSDNDGDKSIASTSAGLKTYLVENNSEMQTVTSTCAIIMGLNLLRVA